MVDAFSNKYQSLSSKHGHNIYDHIKHPVVPGFYMDIPKNERPKYLPVIDGQKKPNILAAPNSTAGHDNDGYLKPGNNGSMSSYDSGISLEKKHDKSARSFGCGRTV